MMGVDREQLRRDLSDALSPSRKIRPCSASTCWRLRSRLSGRPMRSTGG